MAKNQEEFLHNVRNGYATEQITPAIVRQSGFHIAVESNESQSHAPCTAFLLSYERLDRGGKEILVLDIDPYSLLMLAHEIQQKIDPAKRLQ